MQREELIVLLERSLQPALLLKEPGKGQLGVAEMAWLQPFRLLKMRDGLIPLSQTLIAQAQLGMGQGILRSPFDGCQIELKGLAKVPQ